MSATTIANVAARRRAGNTAAAGGAGNNGNNAANAAANAKFATPRGIRNNNCYAYAIGRFEPGAPDAPGRKLQMGDLAGVGGSVDLADCADLRRRVDADSRALGGSISPALADPDAPCKKGWYKIMGFLDPGRDFHWYRQRGSGRWSHKRGHATGPLLEDSCGKPIEDPRRACRSDDKYDYRAFCGAYCVKKDSIASPPPAPPAPKTPKRRG